MSIFFTLMRISLYFHMIKASMLELIIIDTSMMRLNKIILLHMNQSNYNDTQIQTTQEAHANNHSNFD